jgi:tetratricopeptide (TPR) repeat protein
MTKITWLVAPLLIAACVEAHADMSWYELDLHDVRILSNVSRGMTVEVAQSLLDYRAVLRKMFPAMDEHLHTPVQIVFLGPSNDWGLPCGAGCGGVTFPEEGATYIFVGAASELNASRVLLHEFTHELLSQTYHGTLPVWYEEGLAEFFSTTRREHGKIVVGLAPADRWLDLKGMRWMPLQKVFEVSRDSPEYTAHGGAAEFYAESWLLVHYTQLGKPEYVKPIRIYLTGLDRGLNSKDAVASAFSQGLDPLDGELQVYARQSKFRAALIEVPPVASIASDAPHALAPGEGDERLAAMMLEGADRVSEGFLESVISLAKRFHKDRTATILLASTYQLSSKPALADPLLEQACRPPFSKASDAYLCAEAFSKRTKPLKRDSPQMAVAAEQARSCYLEALRIEPDNLQALAGLADTYIAAPGDSARVRALLETALKDDPQNYRISMQLAHLYANVDLQVAKRYGERALIGAQSFEARSEILKLLRNIDTSLSK